LVNSNYPETNLTIDDSCAECAEALRISFVAGQIAAANPESLYLWGGGT
jgi:hypothetical protein